MKINAIRIDKKPMLDFYDAKGYPVKTVKNQRILDAFQKTENIKGKGNEKALLMIDHDHKAEKRL